MSLSEIHMHAPLTGDKDTYRRAVQNNYTQISTLLIYGIHYTSDRLMVHTYTIYIRLISLPGEITYALFRSACNTSVHDPGTTVHILELSSGTLLKPWDLLSRPYVSWSTSLPPLRLSSTD